MAKVFLIRGTAEFSDTLDPNYVTTRQRGYIIEDAIPEGPNFVPMAVNVDALDDCVEKVVAFFSRRSAQEVANKFKKSWEEKGSANSKMFFEVVETTLPDKVVNRIMKKPYKFAYEQN